MYLRWCIVGVGSNLGLRANAIRTALHRLRALPGLTLERTSHLYETDPVHVLQQPRFLNAAFTLRFNAPTTPLQLLKQLKDVEAQMGRDFDALRYGPRPIDLDILFAGNESGMVSLDSETLTIPHPRALERKFVIAPVADIAPELVKDVPDPDPEARVVRVVPIGPGDRVHVLGSRTLVMAVVNVTPDSFSDGTGSVPSPQRAAEHALELLEQGADILDIGGCSTRPNAPAVSEDEELQRVIPAVKAVKSAVGDRVAISVDTFRSKVASAAVDAGADMLNDVLGVPEMAQVAAEKGVPLVIMHSRGDSITMGSLTNYSDLVKDVATQLSGKLIQAERIGVPAFDLIGDPGIGFAKKSDQSLELIRKLDVFRDHLEGLPGRCVLLGPSRKRFLGELLNKPDPKDRDVGTGAVCVAGISTGACDIVRVHNPGVVVDCVRVGDAVSRVGIH